MNKKYRYSIIIFLFIGLEIFSFGCREKKMSTEDENRIKNFMDDFFIKMFNNSFTAKEWEELFYNKLIKI